MSARSDSKSQLSRRKFLLGSAATVAGAAVTVNSERASAFFNAFGFMKKSTGSGQTSNGYTIAQSLRFSGSGVCLDRTFSGGNTQMWTWSGWIKRAGLDATAGSSVLFSSWNGNSNNSSYIATSNNYNASPAYDSLQICLQNGSGQVYLGNTQAVLRDPSAWYHVVVAFDTTGTSNFVRVYINGEAQALYQHLSSLSQGSTSTFNAAQAHYLGKLNTTNFSGYQTEVHFIDGQALDATYFGQTDTNSGQWIPKAYSGNYGTNGFYLKFADNSGVTDSTLGKDSAPLSGSHVSANNWTPSGFATQDQVLDSPTNNFCTLNPLNCTNVTESGGNLTVTATSGTSWGIASTFGMSAGKWYWEATFVSTSVSFYMLSIGISQQAMNGASVGTMISSSYFTGIEDAANWGYLNGVESSNSSLYPHANSAVGNTYGFAFDVESQSLSIYVNGALAFTLTGLNSGTWFPAFLSVRNCTQVTAFNFGQGGQTGLAYNSASGGRFKYTPPAGFKALSTANLPAPAIKKPSQYFNTVLYQGNGATNHAITGVGNQPDLVWIKNRTNPQNHRLFDSVRGATKALYSSLPDAEQSFADTLSAFGTDGFTVGSGDGGSGINQNGDSHVAWCWKGGGGNAVTNNSGSIASQVSVNATSGFSVVTFTANGSAGATVGHGLEAAPAFIALKDRDSSNWWTNYHQSLGATKAVHFHLADAADASTLYWNGTSPTSSVFTLGAGSNPNFSGHRYVAYLWAEVAGFSKFGSYTGNGSSDGPFVYCGFKPRWLMIKRTDGGADHWYVMDSMRSPANMVSLSIQANSSIAEESDLKADFDFLSNGFKARTGGGQNGNESGATYIFAAFAEAPFKYATAR